MELYWDIQGTPVRQRINHPPEQLTPEATWIPFRGDRNQLRAGNEMPLDYFQRLCHRFLMQKEADQMVQKALSLASPPRRQPRTPGEEVLSRLA